MANLYTIVGDQLYKKAFTMSLLKCMDKRQAEYVMSEVHEKVCGSHIGDRSLVAKILRAKYYWPTMRKKCLEYVKICEKCQKYANAYHSLPEELHNLDVSWFFYK